MHKKYGKGQDKNEFLMQSVAFLYRHRCLANDISNKKERRKFRKLCADKKGSNVLKNVYRAMMKRLQRVDWVHSILFDVIFIVTAIK